MFGRVVYQAVYLELLTVGHLRERLASTFGMRSQQIVGINLCTSAGINVAVSDSVRTPVVKSLLLHCVILSIA